MMLQITILLLGFALSLSQLCDNVIFLDAQKKQLNQHFENWWNKVKFYGKHKLALLFAKKVSDVLDSMFGEKIISRRLIFKSSVISTGLLLIALSILNISKTEGLGVAPWKTYQEGIHQILETTSSLASTTNYATYPVFNLQLARSLSTSTNQAIFRLNSDDFLITKDTNGMFEKIDSAEFNHGTIHVYAHKIYKLDSTTTNHPITNAVAAMNGTINDLKRLHDAANVYSKRKYEVLYSAVFYLVMFVLNALLFTLSTIFCKITVREMSKSGGVVSILSLLFTNTFFVIVASSTVMVLMTFISIPLFWVAYPLLKCAASDSIILVICFLFLSGITLLIIIGASTKLVIFTSLIPSLFAALVGLVSVFTVKYRDVFHFLIKNILIRLSQKNPFIFVSGVILFIATATTLLNELISISFKH